MWSEALEQLGCVARWLCVLLALGLAAAPVAARVCGRLPDAGVAIAKPLGLIIVTYVTWLLASLGVRHPVALVIAIGLLAALGLATRKQFRAVSAREAALYETLFIVAFLAFASLRALRPDIIGAEKYMDFALFNAVGRADHFPPEDPWLAGVPVNYYYFGYLLFAEVGRLARVTPEIAYNLSLATVGAVLFTVASSIARALAGGRWLGLLGGGAAALFGNLQAARQVAGRGAFTGFDYWPASRVVPNTINEFPFFSLFHGDLHPHVTALVVTLTLVAVVCGAVFEAAAAGTPTARSVAHPVRFAIFSLVLAAVVLTNPWDLPVVLLFSAFVLLLGEPRRPIVSGVVLAALGASALLLAFPFLRGFTPPPAGIGLVHDKTTLAAFGTVFGVLLLPGAVAVARETAHWFPGHGERRDLVLALGALTAVGVAAGTANAVIAVTAGLSVAAVVALWRSAADRVVPYALLACAVVALLACEVVYVRDSYGEALHRMNTVFKLYFGAWVLLALAFPALVREAVKGLGPIPRGVVGGVIVPGMLASLCYPLAVVATHAAPLSLDGMRYLAREHADDAAAIRWLRKVAGDRPVVLEATGDPYGYVARVSANTGFPTVLGWANHERVWRGNLSTLDDRRADVERLYESTDAAETSALLRRYDVRYVFVGEIERNRFSAAGLAKFRTQSARFVPVFASGATEVFAVRSTGMEPE